MLALNVRHRACDEVVEHGQELLPLHERQHRKQTPKNIVTIGGIAGMRLGKDGQALTYH
jgi:hypothetical protein